MKTYNNNQPNPAYGSTLAVYNRTYPNGISFKEWKRLKAEIIAKESKNAK